MAAAPLHRASLRRCAARAKEAGLDGIDVRANPLVVTEAFVKSVKDDFGLACGVWAGRAPAPEDTPELWDAMAAAGVDFFTTNCPVDAWRWWGLGAGPGDVKTESY